MRFNAMETVRSGRLIRLAAGAALFCQAALAADRPPNVVFILADDLGWSDLGCYGADLHETPHIDRLAQEGMRFTQAYAMPVCSPTRASILTGRHAARLHLTIWREGALGVPRDRQLVPPSTVADLPGSEVTVAEVLKSAGYLTFHVGKWHLGDAAHSPETQGFDLNLGGTHWGAPATYFYPFRGPSGSSGEFRYVPGLLGKPGDYLTDRFTDEALKLMDYAGDRPFFLNLWYHCPHTPVEGKQKLVEHYRAKLKPGFRHQNPGYAAMIQTLDDNVGRILKGIDQRGLADHTLVIFASDNGGYVNTNRGLRVTDNSPLRSGKGSLYEGGIRVPLIVRLPGLTARGQTCDEPVLCTDFFPTITELCAGGRAQPAPAGPLDGVSLVPLLKQPKSHLPRDAMFFHYPHYYPTTTPVSAVRSGDWKLLEYFADSHVELYSLRDDPGEHDDVAKKLPERAAQLRARLHAWWREVGAQFPQPNPAYQPKPQKAGP
jgi:arylsulfatase A-like enzyme